MLIIHTQDIVEFRFNFQSKNLSEREKKGWSSADFVDDDDQTSKRGKVGGATSITNQQKSSMTNETTLGKLKRVLFSHIFRISQMSIGIKKIKLWYDYFK